MVSSATDILICNAVRGVLIHREGERDAGMAKMFFSKGNQTVITSRKLLQSAGTRTLYLHVIVTVINYNCSTKIMVHCR